MAHLRWLLLALLAAAATAHAAAGEVAVMTDTTFDGMTAGGDAWFVEVYAPWCVHCKQLEPVWKQLAADLKGNVRVAKVDGTKETTLLARFHVEAFPSLFFLKDGRTYAYSGQRSLPQLKAFALHGYKSANAMAWWRAPNSSVGRMLGGVYSVPSHANELYRYFSK